MIISYNWLKKYIDIPYSPDELVEKLTMVGIEVESVKHSLEIPETVIAAKVIKREQHPDADRLSVCSVDTGEDIVQVVCGAPNCDAGKIFPLAQIGTVFIDGDKKFKIKKSKLRGIESYGMLCSASELGISNEASGILELRRDLAIGTPVSEIFETDTLYELEITSNRPDWLSFLGVAKEIKALSGNQLKLPEAMLPEVKDTAHSEPLVTIEDFDLCPRYSARVIRDVTVGESPQWLKDSLIKIGLRPINNIVDISNYVLFETGQPLHIFDLDLLAESRIIVRRAKDSETMVALDGKEYKLSQDNLVIADSKKPVCIAGVMGGEHSGVTDSTRNILIETAYFNSSSVRATSKKLGLSSDSSHRFERGVDVSNIAYVSDRTSSLILELAGGYLASEFYDVFNEAYYPKVQSVCCNLDKIRNFLGVSISNEKILEILGALDLSYKIVSESIINVSPPLSRLDIQREADIAEEVIRVYGLERIPVVPIKAIPGGSIKEDSYAKISTAKDQLASLGLNECINYTLADEKLAYRNELFDEKNTIRVANPISSESTILRPTLFDGIMKNIERNISHNTAEIEIFEIGKVYSLEPSNPEESYSCCIALSGRKYPERYSDDKKAEYDFYDLKGLLEAWLIDFRRIENVEFSQSTNKTFKPGLSADIKADDILLGTFGEVSEKYTKGIRAKHPIFAAVIDLDKVLKIESCQKVFTELPQFPATSRDVSVEVESGTSNSEIISCIKHVNCKFLESVDLLDIYEDKSLGDNKRSISYSVVYRADNRTLTDKEVNNAHEKVRNALQKNLGLKLR